MRGVAAGVPFFAKPPEHARESAPTIIVWHMHDPPRSETAMAAALPLRDVDAWRVYLGLPLSGARLPPGGLDAFFALGAEDAVLKLYAPTVQQAVAEFPPAMTALRRDHGIAIGRVAFVGASIGAFVALQLVVDALASPGAIVLVSPALRLTSVVAANERRFGIAYQWSDEARDIAEQLDFVARAPALARRRVPVLVVAGADDDRAGIVEPAESLVAALTGSGCDATLVRIPNMAHSIADEPGLEPSPQNAAAAAVDEVVAAWLRQRCR